MQRVWVRLWVSITMAFNRSTRWFAENTCSTRAEDPRSLFFRAQHRCLLFIFPFLSLFSFFIACMYVTCVVHRPLKRSAGTHSQINRWEYVYCTQHSPRSYDTGPCPQYWLLPVCMGNTVWFPIPHFTIAIKCIGVFATHA